MGFSRVIRRVGWGAALIAVASTAHSANVWMLDDGLPEGTDGHLEIPVDDFGCHGRAFPMSVFDWFKPVGSDPSYPSYMSSAFVFVTTGADTSKILLSDQDVWAGFLEGPPNEDGLAGSHANLARTVITPIGGTPTAAQSVFDLTATGFDLRFALLQTITTNQPAATSLFEQIYTITNNGNTPVDLVFHAAWETDLHFQTNSYGDDVVGVVNGLCAVYVHNPNSSTQAVALSEGAMTTLTTPPFYYGGKVVDPQPIGEPTFHSLSAGDDEQDIWINNGMPVPWRNYVWGAGYNAEGNSGTAFGDATIGLEWHFTLGAGATETIHVRRHYGTTSVPCNVPASCGNGTMDSGEPCDGTDTPTCNGGTCMLSVCGDGYVNPMADEACESSSGDSETCNAATCTAAACGDGYINNAAGELCDDGEETADCTATCQPSTCGDGYINAAAEECDGDALCDPVTCEVTFTVGGGCAGCGTRDTGAGATWLVGLALALTARRRRRARRA